MFVEKGRKPLTIPPFCSELLTELPSGRFAGISRAICRAGSAGIKSVCKERHEINDLSSRPKLVHKRKSPSVAPP
jgi:hypothetical protein